MFESFFYNLGVPWGSALGALGESILGSFWAPFWVPFGALFFAILAPKRASFSKPFSGPPGAYFLTVLLMRAHFPGVHSGPSGNACW